jgi:hypothetical protein
MFGRAHAACLAASRVSRFGYTPDKTFDQRPHFSTRMSPDVAFFSSSLPSKTAYSGTPFNQSNVGSCGGHGTAKALRQAYLSAGYAWPFPGSEDFSPKWFYGLGRRLSTPATSASGPPLTDSGIDPTTLLQVIPQFGVVPIGTDAQCPAPDGSYSDCYSTNCNDDVQLDAEIKGRLELDFTAYNIDASGTADQIAFQVGSTLSAPGLANAFGIFVDSAFENWDPSQGPLSSETNLNDPNGGGHWIDEDEITMTYVHGTRCWGFLNSWSESWGLNGRIYVTDARLVSMTSQIIAFKANRAMTPWGST